jgi:hypothetical protein
MLGWCILSSTCPPLRSFSFPKSNHYPLLTLISAMSNPPLKGRPYRGHKKSRVGPNETPKLPKPRPAARPPYDGPPYDWRQMTPGSQCYYLRTIESANEAIDSLLRPTRPAVVGFDIEWRPTFKANQPDNPVSLIQISSGSKTLLLHISAMGFGSQEGNVVFFLKAQTLTLACHRLSRSLAQFSRIFRHYESRRQYQ